MPDIKQNDLDEPKLLGEECWIDLEGGGRIRVDYLTQSQRRQFHALAVRWHFGQAFPEQDHEMGYFVRCACKEVDKSFLLDGKPAKLTIEYGMARTLKTDDAEVDFLTYLEAAGLLSEVEDKVFSKLNFDGTGKKNLKSLGGSSATGVSAASPSGSGPELESSTVGDPSPRTEERTM